MCVAAVAWAAHPEWRMVVIGNRDEYHERPTAPLARWDNGVIAGRDLRAGGTWLGASDAGRFALVTNYRVEGYPRPDRQSRGALVTDWLERGDLGDGAAMNPFNLLVADSTSARIISNWPEPAGWRLEPGLHGLSNGAFVQPWPKTQALCAALDAWLKADAHHFAPLFAALRDDAPITGDGPEQRFSPVFIADPTYGTRCSTVAAIRPDGSGILVERSFDAAGQVTGERSERLAS